MSIPNISLGPKPTIFTDPIQRIMKEVIPFPPRIYNLRVTSNIHGFLLDYALFIQKLVTDVTFELELDGLESNGLYYWKLGNLLIVGRPDEKNGGVLNYFRVIIKDFPVLVSSEAEGEYIDTLAFRIILHRYYPARVDFSIVTFDSIPFHPYINPYNGLFNNYRLCGEIGNIIWDILQLVLFEPARIFLMRDPDDSLDFAVNKEAVAWYQKQDKENFYRSNIERFKSLLRKQF